MKNPQCQTDHLQVFGPSSGRDISWLGADVVDNSLLEPRDEEVGSLIDNLDIAHIPRQRLQRGNNLENANVWTNSFLDTRQPVENNSPASALDVVDRQLEQRNADGCRDSETRNEAQDSRHW